MNQTICGIPVIEKDMPELHCGDVVLGAFTKEVATRNVASRAEFLAYWTEQWLLYGKLPPGVEQDADGNLKLIDGK